MAVEISFLLIRVASLVFDKRAWVKTRKIVSPRNAVCLAAYRKLLPITFAMRLLEL
jgi:hypothetical protein